MDIILALIIVYDMTNHRCYSNITNDKQWTRSMDLGEPAWLTHYLLSSSWLRCINFANKSSATAELVRDAENVHFSVDDVRKT